MAITICSAMAALFAYLHMAIPRSSVAARAHRQRRIVMTADSRKVFEEMVLPPFAFSYDAMREVIEGYRKMELAGARLIFGLDPVQWKADGSLAIPLA
jgi:hypothetical protein